MISQKLNQKLLSSLFILVSVPSLIAVTAINSQAQTWDYAADGVGDDLGVWQGNHRNSFDMLGMGIKDDGENVYVGILSKLNHTGLNIDRVDNWDVENNNIGYGDFFFDFTGGGNFRDNVKHGNVLGVKFLWGNDSDPYIGTGVYDNIQAIGVQDKNAGYGNIGRYYNSVNYYGRGHNVSFGDLAWNDNYWGDYRDSTYGYGREFTPNILTGGNRVGDVSFLNYSALYDQGFSLDSFSSTENSYLFGFQIARDLLPSGDFVASFFQECLNDGMALLGNLNPFNPPTDPPPVDDGNSGDPPPVDDDDDNSGDPPPVDDDDNSGDPPPVDDDNSGDPPPVDDDNSGDPPPVDDDGDDNTFDVPPFDDDTNTPQSVPEPSGLLGLMGVGWLASRLKKKAS